MKHLVLSTFALCITIAAGAQVIPVNPKFGAVSDAEVDLAVYEPDTSAVALMLYRSYDLELVFDGKLDIVQEITVHERIKVLKEDGKKYADYSFLYSSDNDLKESFSGIKVETYNRENGKVVKTKMSKKYEFDEKYAEDVRRLSFTAENVKVGSVIEVAYKFVSPRYWDIDNIYLQLAIPVNETDVSVGVSEYFHVNHSQRGYLLPAYSHDDRRKSTPVSGGMLSYQEEFDHYHLVDAPAMQAEPFSYCPSQYRSQVMYDLSGVSIPGSVYRDFSKKWPAVDKAIAESDILEVSKSKFRDAKELEAALQGVEGDEARIVAVRKFVTDRVKWDEKSRLVPDAAREILKRGSGSDVDINALTASALNTAGFTAEPVMVRHRAEGVLMDFHASLNAFNTFILKVTSPDGSQSWFLDAAREHGYLNILDPGFLVTQARLIHLNGAGEWVNLTKLTRGNRINELVVASLSPEGNLVGKSEIKAHDQASWEVKDHYADFDTEDAYLDEIEADEGLEVTSFEIQKEYGPSTTITYTFEKDLGAGERMYVRPFLSTFHSATTFKKEERQVPVDFPCPEFINYSFKLDIPEEYEVEELPQNASLTSPNLGGRIIFQCKAVGNQVAVSYRFNLDEALVLPDKYPDLRYFWETAADIEKSTIVLKKK